MQVVDLVLKAAGEFARGLQAHRTIQIESLDEHFRRPLHGCRHPGNTEAAFDTDDPLFARRYDPRVD